MPNISIQHQPAQQRFEHRSQGQLSICSYRRQGDVLDLHHTLVPPAQQGQGIAAALVQAALDWARSEGLKVRPSCSYVSSYMRRHPATQDLMASGGLAG